jgi:REP element-mobilizing transposase RayT
MAPSFTSMKSKRIYPRNPTAYGGELLKTRAGRRHGRPLSASATMHFVLRSSRARGPLSFRRPQNEELVRELLRKFTRKSGIHVLDLAIPGNHLHLHVKIRDRRSYKAFIRAFTGSVARCLGAKKLWDRRPFSRVVRGRRDFLGLRDYIRLNQLETLGLNREEAHFALGWEKAEWEESSRRSRIDSS